MYVVSPNRNEIKSHLHNFVSDFYEAKYGYEIF